ncbi:histidinol-phosphatase [Salinarimonas ramus]|uniref:Histidinol-phosphatase n=1 Tax=Salinarimonas ramus TaxID=690164 RepID=A0A917V5K4_9HYPH|nr:histidinol-phosphatase [Salinarimonas ramus]GGK39832.1 histidinol-phosphatase [Salinarimonas ramus]
MALFDFASFVDDLATASGKAILPFFRTSLTASDKGGRGGVFDPVTEADKAGESAMRHLIKRAFPSHGIVGEEYGVEQADAEYVWVLDPIDGTRGFISGLPSWGTLIGLTRNGRPCYGMMHQPFTRERFSGDGGKALYRGPMGGGEPGERRLRTRRCASLAEATLSSTSPHAFPTAEEGEAFARLAQGARNVRYGADCYAYCMVAAGHIDLVVEAGLAPYDIVALIPIIEGAGGIVTTWDGGDPARGGRILAAGDKRVHEEAMRVLAG